MAQTFNATKPESGVTTFGELYQIIRDHNDTLRSSFSGTAFPTNPTTGQLCWRSDRGTSGYLYIFTGNTAIGESGWVSNTDASALGLEVINARGSKPTLDQRLDVVLNEDGTLKDGVSVNYSEWVSPPFSFTYLSTNSFSVPGDQTDIYVVGRRLKINLGASVVYSEVIQAEYTTETTVTIANTVLDASLVSVEHSFIKPLEENGSVNASMVGAYSKSETDNTVVKLTGDQTIGGVKTFSSNPIVPTPTTDSQAANKAYIDTQINGLGTAATADLTTSVTDGTTGRVLKVGDFSIGKIGGAAPLPVSNLNDLNMNGVFNVMANTPNWAHNSSGGVVQQFMHSSDLYITQIAYSSLDNRISTRTKINSTTWTPWVDLIHTDNILQTTGSSTEFPMSQKAVTDAINSTSPTSAQVGTATAGLGSGGVGTYAFLARKYTMVNYGFTINPGTTLEASSLWFHGFFHGTNMENFTGVVSSIRPVGTWRCMGYAYLSNYLTRTDYYSPTLWLRIA